MKCRSIILVACMLIVPSLAMFSHKIPSDIRAAMRRSLRESLAGCLGRPAEAGLATASTAPAEALQPARGSDPQPTGSAPTAADGLSGGLRPISDAPTAAVAAPPLVSQLADRSRQARDQHSIEVRLKDLGAVSLDCQPLAGTAGLHSSSCRVPIDATGQLQRVFQATGSDPVTASEALLQQVTEWRQRTAAQPPSAITAGTADQNSATRFR